MSDEAAITRRTDRIRPPEPVPEQPGNRKRPF
jgi:hypothetical protein